TGRPSSVPNPVAEGVRDEGRPFVGRGGAVSSPACREWVVTAVRLLLVGAILVCRAPAAPAPTGVPPAVEGGPKQREDEAAEVEKKTEEAVNKQRDRTLSELKKVQDQICKDAKLDEAVAVRDLIRHFRAGTTGPLAADLPDAARVIWKQHEAEVAAIL